LLGKFERKKMDATRPVAGDKASVIRTDAALHAGIANEGGDNRASPDIPEIERIVERAEMAR
jgi:hypothetical protein